MFGAWNVVGMTQKFMWSCCEVSSCTSSVTCTAGIGRRATPFFVLCGMLHSLLNNGFVLFCFGFFRWNRSHKNRVPCYASFSSFLHCALGGSVWLVHCSTACATVETVAKCTVHRGYSVPARLLSPFSPHRSIICSAHFDISNIQNFEIFIAPATRALTLPQSSLWRPRPLAPFPFLNRRVDAAFTPLRLSPVPPFTLPRRLASGCVHFTSTAQAALTADPPTLPQRTRQWDVYTSVLSSSFHSLPSYRFGLIDDMPRLFVIFSLKS